MNTGCHDVPIEDDEGLDIWSVRRTDGHRGYRSHRRTAAHNLTARGDRVQRRR